MVQLQYLWKAIQCYQQGQVGDTAAYKALLLPIPTQPDLNAQLTMLEQPFPQMQLADLQQQPLGSFGWCVAQFIANNKIQPICISPAVKTELQNNHSILALRYLLVHDAFHVLLGFDTTFAGELGVWSFVATQGYSASYRRAAAIGRLVYPLLSPGQRQLLRENDRRGQQLGQQAVCLIAQPLERYWSWPLVKVQAHFNLPQHQP